MKNRSFFLAVVSGCILFLSSARAQRPTATEATAPASAPAPASTSTSAAKAPTDLVNGDALNLVQKGNANGATACMACHGLKGEGNPASGFPRLANQHSDYMISQLNDYASGVRVHPVMGPIAKALTEDEKEKVSSYYEHVSGAAYPSAGKASKTLVQLGEKLSHVGNEKLQVQACSNCHGPGGVGVGPLIPGLAGQNSKYIISQIKAWKAGERKNSPMQMVPISQRLDDKSIEALAAYFQQVRP